MQKRFANRPGRALAGACAAALLAGCATAPTEPVDWTQPGPYSVRVQEVAKEFGRLSVGYHSDMSSVVGDTCIASAVWSWTPSSPTLLGRASTS